MLWFNWLMIECTVNVKNAEINRVSRANAIDTLLYRWNELRNWFSNSVKAP